MNIVPKAGTEIKTEREAAPRNIYWIAVGFEYRFLAGFL